MSGDPGENAMQVKPIQGPITTADSAQSQRLVVDAGSRAKKKKALYDRVKQIAKVRKQSMEPQN